ncbi:N5-glutamine methyltransferase family protein [Lentzea californiensis]|uniref:N5-glutamine methyltransferase family protein n=1 Tax=Lentzea californiensis TaxID=438851 RepID=UPI002164DD56|nr:HemK/PrmC family methyltransferase [Lentzea californiensis]MCR3747839.1 release factor glutamine methyltransferase [Lentzea californiensis]
MTSRPLAHALADAERKLTAAGVWAPRSDAEVLAAHVLGVLEPDAELDAVQAAELDRLVARRAERIPLAYVTGWAELGGVRVAVGPGVFVPRPHTEPLLAWGLERLRGVSDPVVVDLCTGSGALALAIAHARPDATVHAVELSDVALDFALRNAKQRAEAGDTAIRLVRGDVTDPELFHDLHGAVDLVVANPPFVPMDVDMLPEWSEHQPLMAMYAGSDGTFVLRHVIALAARLARPGGGFAVEHGDPQVDVVAALMRDTGVLTGITNHPDHHGDPRFTTAHRRI